MRRLHGDRHGGVGLLVAIALPVLIGISAFAVDLGSMTLETRRLQGIADGAALAAAADPANADIRARAYVTAAGWPRAVTTTVAAGNYAANPAVAADQRFSAGGTLNAVRVDLASTSPTFFATLFGIQGIAIARHAVATREKVAAFSIGSRLAAFQGGVVNGYLSALTGSSISLSAADYNALASADVDLLGVLGSLRSRASLKAATFDDILKTPVDSSTLLGAIGDTLGQGSAAAAALRSFASAPGRTVTLASLIDLGLVGKQATGPQQFVRINALQLVTAALQLASPTRQLSFDTSGDVAGVASTHITVAIGERPNNSPLLTVTGDGTPIIRTAQARIYVENILTAQPLPGLVLAQVRTPLFGEAAGGEARLKAIDCPTATARSVTIEARTDPAQAAIAAVDTSKLADFTTPITLGYARLLDAPLIKVDGYARIDLGAVEPWQSLTFNADQIAAATPQTVSSSAWTQGIAASLTQNLSLKTTVGGLFPIAADPIAKAVGAQLALVAPALDTLLDTATGTVGVRLGQADVRVTGVRCGMAALVG